MFFVFIISYVSMKKFLIITGIILGFLTQAQGQDRTSVSGSIQVPVGDESVGIIVYNLNTEDFALTNPEGEFSIAVKLNDSLRISAAQFQEFIVIIDKGVIQSGELNIYVNEIINVLPEVVVSPYDLSGNVTVDAARLPVNDLPENYTASQMQSTYFASETGPSYQSSPKNTALAMSQTRLVNGINFVNIFKELLIASKKDEIRDPYSERPNADIDTEIRAMYGDEFFQENLNIDLEYINDFIYFADDSGLKEEMLQKGNELELIEFLVEQSKQYKKQRSGN
ncbi:hypothetical protein GILI108418_01705 [Gillisia limnaea]|uniref:Uncharacterized protein n=2 Tax=Gillisia TaxID=244698 RepID=H2BZ47_GILLR|nr:hypothetical protein Gilli_2779 [Gillisia limnaea DSM 15749]